MSEVRKISCEGFNKGMFVSWYVTTQAANKITVKLWDTKTKRVYFEGSKQSRSIFPALAQGADYIDGDNMVLEVSSSGNDDVQIWFNNSHISSQSTGKTVGQYFVASGEDQKGGDDDYNDVCIALVAWKSKD